MALIALLTAFNRPGPATEPKTILIEPGTPTQAVLAKLAEAKIVRRAWVARLGWRFLLGGATLQAGEYRFPARVTPAQALRKLRAGRTLVHRLTVPEGLTSHAIANLLRAEKALAGPVGALPPQGTLLPETYHYRRGTRRRALLNRMRAKMTAFLDKVIPKSLANRPLAQRGDVVTLASIVAREAGAGDKRLVASVFLNRLRRGMRLQADATVLYALTKGAAELGRPLTRNDWNVESPYNTYRHSGLPPGPIAHPGPASIRAVLNPAQTDYYYFVATERGTHLFAETLDEHRANMARIRAGETRVPRDPRKLSR